MLGPNNRLGAGSLVKDFTSSLVVFLVALPLCMGIAIASGVPPILGLIAGMIGGLIVGPLSGAPLQVSGPAAGLAVMVFEFVNRYGLSSLVPLGLTIGVVQILAYRFRIATYFKAVSPSLLKGLMCGIGVLILLSQIYVALDLAPIGTGFKNMIGFPAAFFNNVVSTGSSLTPFLVCVGTIAVIQIWANLQFRWTRSFPAPLVGIMFTALACYLLNLSVRYVEIPDNLLSALQVVSLDSFSNFSAALFLSAVGIAFVASAETLLCTKATDVMSRTGQSDYNKEMLAQGVGHVAAGLVGALPITGVIVRSTANVQSGARTRLSTILHGFWLVLLVFFAPGVLSLIPISALAGILILTGFKLIDFKGVFHLIRENKKNAFVFLATLLVIVSVDLLVGVMIGFAASIFVLANDLLSLEVNTEADEERKVVKVKFEGRLSFLQIPLISEQLNRTNGVNEVTLDLTGVEYLDQGAKEEIQNWKELNQSRGEGRLHILPPQSHLDLAI